MSKIVHIDLCNYIGIQEEDGSYSIINPQTLEGYQSSLEEIQKHNIKMNDVCPVVPVYDKYGKKIEYPLEMNWPEKDHKGNKIEYLDEDEENKVNLDLVFKLLPRMPKTNECVQNFLEFHYDKKYLPSWVKVNEFYNHLTRDLLGDIFFTVLKGERLIFIESFLVQLCSNDLDLSASAGLEDKIDGSYIKIPGCVIREFIENKLVKGELFDERKLKDESTSMPYTHGYDVDDDEEEEEDD